MTIQTGDLMIKFLCGFIFGVIVITIGVDETISAAKAGIVYIQDISKTLVN